MTYRVCRLVVSFTLALAPQAGLSQAMQGGARSAALGGATTAVPGAIWGHTNPATWASLSGTALGFYANQAYALTELRLGAVQVVHPFSFAAIGLGAQTFGFEDYRESAFQLGVARSVRLGTTRAVHLGVMVTYHQVNIATYGHAGAAGVSLGWQVEIVPVLMAGFHATNLNRPRYVEGLELPRTFALGLAYEPLDGILVVTDVFKDVRFPVSVRAGLEVAPVAALSLRAGITSNPSRFSTGAGLHLGPLRADLVAERHYALGWSPGVALGLTL